MYVFTRIFNTFNINGNRLADTTDTQAIDDSIRPRTAEKSNGSTESTSISAEQLPDRDEWVRVDPELVDTFLNKLDNVENALLNIANTLHVFVTVIVPLIIIVISLWWFIKQFLYGR